MTDLIGNADMDLGESGARNDAYRRILARQDRNSNGSAVYGKSRTVFFDTIGYRCLPDLKEPRAQYGVTSLIRNRKQANHDSVSVLSRLYCAEAYWSINLDEFAGRCRKSMLNRT